MLLRQTCLWEDFIRRKIISNQKTDKKIEKGYKSPEGYSVLVFGIALGLFVQGVKNVHALPLISGISLQKTLFLSVKAVGTYLTGLYVDRGQQVIQTMEMESSKV